MKYLTFLFIFTINGTLFGQIFCPDGDTFQGNVTKVESKVYAIQQRPIVGLNDSLQLLETSTTIVKDGKTIRKAIRYPSGEPMCYCQNVYAPNNLLVERTIYTSDSLVDVKKFFHYSGNVNIKTEYLNRKNEIFSTRIYEIDSLHLISKSMEIIGDKIEDVRLDSLNKSYLPLMSCSVDEEGRKHLIALIEYDSLNRVRTRILFDNNSSFESKIIYSYDKFNRVTERNWCDKNGNSIGKDSIVYDNNSNVIYSRNYVPHRDKWETTSFEYKYDEYGNYVTKLEWSIYGTSRYLIRREERKITYE